MCPGPSARASSRSSSKCKGGAIVELLVCLNRDRFYQVHSKCGKYQGINGKFVFNIFPNKWKMCIQKYMYKVLFGISGIWLGVYLASALFLEKWKVKYFVAYLKKKEMM